MSGQQRVAPDPAEFEALLASATRLRVVGLTFTDEPPDTDRLWGELTGPALDVARDLLAIRPPEEEDGEPLESECDCEPDCHLQLYRGDELLAVVDYHGDHLVMRRRWSSLAVLVHGDALDHWFDARGIADPRDE